MRASQLLAVIMSPALMVMLAGCGSSTPPKATAAPVVQAASPEQAAMAQSDIGKIDPNARVGHVAAVNSSVGMASVSGIPTNEVKVGDTLVFIDARQNPIANGTVRSIDTTTDSSYQFLIVEYKPNSGSRDVNRGDLAVYLPAAH